MEELSTADVSPALRQAAQVLSQAEALLITAGAGMGVDSGLPDFRGRNGLWSNHPIFHNRPVDVMATINPLWFLDEPRTAWGFHGSFYSLVRRTAPHAGFSVLKTWHERLLHGAFVYTSNIDGQFLTAGFPPGRTVEIHGSMHWLQCTRDCGVGLFASERQPVEVEEATFTARGPLPVCPSCGAPARPNMCMFGDAGWDPQRTLAQFQHLHRWLARVKGSRLVIVECGAGTAIPSVRNFSEEMVEKLGGRLIRINVAEPWVERDAISIALGAREALERIHALAA